MKQTNSFFSDLGARIICLLLAAAVFFVVFFSGEHERRITLPVEVILPEDYVAVSNIPYKADLVIKGLEERIYMIDTSDIRLSADFSHPVSEGVTTVPITIEAQDLNRLLDSGSVSMYTDPGSLKIFFEKKEGL